MINPNRVAFLTMVAQAEGTHPIGYKGYDVLFGATVTKPRLFTSFRDHPRIETFIPRLKKYTSAAGRYQIEDWVFDDVKKPLLICDFTPASQDACAIFLINRKHALDDIDAGNIADAITKCSGIWASLPGNDYDQPQKPVETLIGYYTTAGGILAPAA